MMTLFIDESGDHNLTKIHSDYPIFVLTGIILDSELVETKVNPAMNQVKENLFNSKEIILHTADIVRNHGPFVKLKDLQTRQIFYEQLNQLIMELPFKVIACIIDKPRHKERYSDTALDPYQLSLIVLVERFVYELRDHQQDSGEIIAESRGASLDEQLRFAWEGVKTRGTQYIRASEIRRRISDLTIRPKSDNSAGLQLADLVASPIGRHYLGKIDHEDYALIEQKFRRHPTTEKMEGYGLIILPKLNG